jgi:hypothetical protein
VIKISHLMFADDTLIFYGANPYHFCYPRALFLCFKVVSSLRINLAKLELVPIGNINNGDGLAGFFRMHGLFFAFEVSWSSVGSLF